MSTCARISKRWALPLEPKNLVQSSTSKAGPFVNVVSASWCLLSFSKASACKAKIFNNQHKTHVSLWNFEVVAHCNSGANLQQRNQGSYRLVGTRKLTWGAESAPEDIALPISCSKVCQSFSFRASLHLLRWVWRAWAWTISLEFASVPDCL